MALAPALDVRTDVLLGLDVEADRLTARELAARESLRMFLTDRKLRKAEVVKYDAVARLAAPVTLEAGGRLEHWLRAYEAGPTRTARRIARGTPKAPVTAFFDGKAERGQSRGTSRTWACSGRSGKNCKLLLAVRQGFEL
jgi:hypothetical protein